MTDFLLGMAEITISMSAVIVLALIFSRLFGKKFSAKCRYIVWGLIIIRLAFPISVIHMPTLFTFEVPVYKLQESIPSETEAADFPLPESSAEADNNTTLRPDISFEFSSDVDSDEVFVPTIPAQPSEEKQSSEFLAQTETEKDLSSSFSGERKLPYLTLEMLPTVIFCVWLIGALTYFTVHAVGSYAATVEYNHTRAIPSRERQKCFMLICKKFGIKKYPKFYISKEVSSPLVCGYFRSTVYLPDLPLTSDATIGILSHELVHYKRGDLFFKLISLFSESLHWFNPFVHIASKKCNAEMELSCDEVVLNGMNAGVRQVYGNVMLDIIKNSREKKTNLTTMFNPERSAVMERFKNILDISKKKHGRIVIAFFLVFTMVSGTIVGCSLSDQNNENIGETYTDKEVLELVSYKYREAERIFAYFTGYNVPKASAEFTEFNGVRYDIVAEEEIDSLEKLTSLCLTCFTAEYTESLLKKTVADGNELYIGNGNVLYRFGGYAAQWGYNVGDNKYTAYGITERDGNKYTVKVTSSAKIEGVHLSAETFLGVEIIDGEVFFSSFSLAAEEFFNQYINGEAYQAEDVALNGINTNDTVDSSKKYDLKKLDIDAEKYRITHFEYPNYDTVDYAYCVEYVFENENSPGELYHFVMRIPEIYGDTANIKRFNEKIAYTYFELYDGKIRFLEKLSPVGRLKLEINSDVNSYTIRNGDIVILAVHERDCVSEKYGKPERVTCYYYDLEKDREISGKEFLETLTDGKLNMWELVKKMNEEENTFSPEIAGTKLTVDDISGIFPEKDGEGFYVFYSSPANKNDSFRYAYYKNGELLIKESTPRYPYTASTFPELENLGEDGRRALEYVRAFVGGDTRKLEKLCGVEDGWYDDYATVKVKEWKVELSYNKFNQLVTRFSFYPTESEIEEFKLNEWNHFVLGTSVFTGEYIERENIVKTPTEAEQTAGYPELLNLLYTSGTFEFPKEKSKFPFSFICYIIGKLGNADRTKNEFTLREIQDYVKDHFGIENYVPDSHKNSNGNYSEVGHGGYIFEYEIIDGKEYNGESHFTVQLYADASHTVKSHKYLYKMKKENGEWKFLSAEITEHSDKKPMYFGL